MKNDLTCAVVQDLLPSYAEGLTSEETNQAVNAHLAACPSCAACRDAMTSPDDTTATEQAKEVDYLKTVKRKTGRRVVLAVICTLAAIFVGVALKLFIIGEPASREGMSWSLQEEEAALNIRAYTNSSGIAYCRWKMEDGGGVVRITCKKVLPSFLYRDADHRDRISLDGVKEVWLANQLLWQDGVVILEGDDLYAAKTPYVGDISALNKIAAELHIQPHVGDYTNSLQTANEPYRWTLEFSAGGWQGVWRKSHIEEDMPRYAAQMLALAENLGEVGWTWIDEEGICHSDFVTLEEINAQLEEWTAAYNVLNGTDWIAPSSVKDYADSPSNLQRLVEICALS